MANHLMSTGVYPLIVKGLNSTMSLDEHANMFEQKCGPLLYYDVKSQLKHLPDHGMLSIPVGSGIIMFENVLSQQTCEQAVGSGNVGMNYWQTIHVEKLEDPVELQRVWHAVDDDARAKVGLDSNQLREYLTNKKMRQREYHVALQRNLGLFLAQMSQNSQVSVSPDTMPISLSNYRLMLQTIIQQNQQELLTTCCDILEEKWAALGSACTRVEAALKVISSQGGLHEVTPAKYLSAVYDAACRSRISLDDLDLIVKYHNEVMLETAAVIYKDKP